MPEEESNYEESIINAYKIYTSLAQSLAGNGFGSLL
jgi:hypothetical protein